MSCQDLPELQAKLKEATEQEARDILELFKTLTITFDQLATTKVGKTVQRVCKKYPSLTYKGKDLINSWQKVVSKAVKKPQVVSGQGEERRSITKVLAKVLGDEAVATELEAALHGAFSKANYAAKARSIHFNLKKNASLRQRLIQGDVTCAQLANMTPAEMATEEDKEQRAKHELDLLEGRRSDWNLVHNTPKDGLYKCKKCHSKQTVAEQKQTRSADEPMTTFVKCLNCNNGWKF
jgi:DNA-directed RNA polymerase subunit M/transcription elongation factor TFIIS